MSKLSQRRKQRTGTEGFSLIELLIAMLVLTVGLLGGMIVIVTAIASNARARLDSTAVALAQSTMDRIVALSSAAVPQQTSLTDCEGTVHTISTASGGGAPLIDVTGLPDGKQMIDFTQPAVTNYSMVYVLCATGSTAGGVLGVKQKYDVRWNVSDIPNSSFASSSQLVQVAAKNIGEAGNGMKQSQFFTIPITLRAVRGN
ncbi:MAG: prepilin-type N-terminal cleavage/methylation domain-containing protein [Terriglobales bacterium]|jgi:type IV pilus modification protein PilV